MLLIQEASILTEGLLRLHHIEDLLHLHIIEVLFRLTERVLAIIEVALQIQEHIHRAEAPQEVSALQAEVRVVAESQGAHPQDHEEEGGTNPPFFCQKNNLTAFFHRYNRQSNSIC